MRKNSSYFSPSSYWNRCNMIVESAFPIATLSSLEEYCRGIKCLPYTPSAAMSIKLSESSRKEHKYTIIGTVTGEGYGDRLTTPYHRSVSTICKGFQKGGDRLKEELEKSIGIANSAQQSLFFSNNPVSDSSCRTVEVDSYLYNTSMIRLIRYSISFTVYLFQRFFRCTIYLELKDINSIM